MRTYPCRYCGEPIHFATVRGDVVITPDGRVEVAVKQPQPAQRRRVIAIHVDGKPCIGR